MEQSEFHTIAIEWTKHLSGYNNLSFEKLVDLSKQNRRVRNVFMFYVYSDNEFAVKFEEKIKTDKDLIIYKYEFAKALERLKKDNRQSENFISKLYNRYFRGMNVDVDYEKYDISAEMSKLFNTMTSCYRLKDTPEKKEYRNRIKANLNLAQLIG
ncbi:hypothetical protein [Fictibacillus norfolkensis]|uniref:Uncharacterized protein n=1 Tax=Fictibacillus norfolkensis TaxID=2762233 RepID=A0ABR8SPH2_9BACL|nr:hypothetical protein [Fictibacillus norfolkensis]MBD7965395.1 hypothetical protein [Fictibacillus norfolkensis]